MKSFTNLLQNSKNKVLLLYTCASVLLIFAFALGIFSGSIKIGIADLINSVFSGDKSDPNMRIFLYVRLPRTIAGIMCGAALAVAGAVIQSVLANPLASPSIIGVNSGAGLAVTLCCVVGIGGWKLSAIAFLGAFFAVMLVSIGAWRWRASRGTVVLIGVAMNSLFGAVSDALLTFYPDTYFQSRDFKLGDFSAVTYSVLIPLIVTTLITVSVLIFLSGDLSVLTLGDESATSLGMNTKAMRIVFLLLSALLAGVAVSVAGLLSFVGLLVPHAVRRMSRGSHLLPLCALFGAGFISLCDTVSRVAFAPYEIPVGIIMAFLGAPFFIFILVRGKGVHDGD